jgi:hypothetical protein
MKEYDKESEGKVVGGLKLRKNRVTRGAIAAATIS